MYEKIGFFNFYFQPLEVGLKSAALSAAFAKKLECAQASAPPRPQPLPGLAAPGTCLRHLVLLLGIFTPWPVLAPHPLKALGRRPQSQRRP